MTFEGEADTQTSWTASWTGLWLEDLLSTLSAADFSVKGLSAVSRPSVAFWASWRTVHLLSAACRFCLASATGS